MTVRDVETQQILKKRRYGSPILWARLGTLSKWIAQKLAPGGPPVLVLSLPRSGSSWVGRTLGRAVDALYLREPVTQSDKSFYYMGTVFPPDTPEVEPRYAELADKAFMGWPDFGRHIVRFPLQWALVWRRPRRVVVKEVNPLACDWYLRRYQPRLVYLVRHPAGVALSWHKKHWLSAEPDAWRANGEEQGAGLKAALEAIEEYPSHMVVVYRELCADPMNVFEKIFSFTGLTWNDEVQEFIRRNTGQSAAMIGAWRPKVPPDALAALREGYEEFDLPWYRSDEDW
jgi:hypothetical protein